MSGASSLFISARIIALFVSNYYPLLFSVDGKKNKIFMFIHSV